MAIFPILYYCYHLLVLMQKLLFLSHSVVPDDKYCDPVENEEPSGACTPPTQLVVASSSRSPPPAAPSMRQRAMGQLWPAKQLTAAIISFLNAICESAGSVWKFLLVRLEWPPRNQRTDCTCCLERKKQLRTASDHLFTIAADDEGSCMGSEHNIWDSLLFTLFALF